MKLSQVKNTVAFFCAEFAIDSDLPTYAGGLGVLAGDLINAAGTSNLPMVGIGVLYFHELFCAPQMEGTEESPVSIIKLKNT